MLTDLQIAETYQSGIRQDPVAGGPWASVFGGILGKVGVAKVGDTNLIVWPGSKYGMDWIEDAEAIPFDHPLIGTVHLGMIGGVMVLKARLDPFATGKWVSVGHSLGAAHALLYGAWRAADGFPPQRIIALAPPRCSYARMWEVLAGRNVQFETYWNEGLDGIGDLVPTLPETLPLFPWARSPRFTMLHAGGAAGDTGEFRFHHLERYIAGMKLREAGKV